MFKQMVRLWIAIPFIMFFLVITGLAADFMYRVVEENYMTVAIITLVVYCFPQRLDCCNV